MDQAPDRTDSLTRAWIEDLTVLLANLPDTLLWRAAESLGENRVEWLLNQNKHRALAASLLSNDSLDAVYSALREVMHFLPPDYANLAAERAKPLWVDLDAARIVNEASQLPYDRRVVGVRTRAYRLGLHTCLRATVSSPKYGMAALPDITAESPLQELTERYDRTIRELLHLSKYDEPETVAREFRDYLGIYALMRCDTLDIATTAALVEIMQTRFPGITFVLLGNRSSQIWEKLPMRHAFEELDRTSELSARRYVSRIAGLAGERIPVDSND